MRVDWQTVKHHFFTRAFLLFLIVGTISVIAFRQTKALEDLN